METRDIRKRRIVMIILVNFVSLVLLLFLVIGNFNNYRERIENQSINEIMTMNQNVGNIAYSFIEQKYVKLSNTRDYIEDKGLNYDESFEFIQKYNSNSESETFQILKETENETDGIKHLQGKAYLLDKNEFRDVDYNQSEYSTFVKLFNYITDDANYLLPIHITPHFTDDSTGATVIGLFHKVNIVSADDPNIKEQYYLIYTINSDYINNMDLIISDYESLTSFVMSGDGDFIFKSNKFQSNNFYTYLSNNIGISKEKIEGIKSDILSNGNVEGYFDLTNRTDEQFLFAYSYSKKYLGWYSVTRVDYDDLIDTKMEVEKTFIVIISVFFAFFMIFNLLCLQNSNVRLKYSIQKEREASAAKGNFMSRMSHEIRTPLNAVIGYNTIAKNTMAEAKTVTDYRQAEMKVMDCLVKSSIASKHLLSIVNDVLNMSAIESGRVKISNERFDFKNLITSLTTVFYSQAKYKGVEFEVIFSTLTEEWFIGDQMRTSQILTNLLSNAIKFTPEGGLVKLVIEQPDALSNASHIHFQIIDNGIGMSEEYLEKIWVPFEQADSSISRVYGGTGLGLAITKSLVDLLGGTISVKSKTNEGTTFDVDLTFERCEQPKVAKVYNFSYINALVVDDDAYTCDYITQLFNRCGAHSSSATNGEDAIKVFENSKRLNDPFNLFLIDWRMPDTDGLQIIKKLRKLAGEDVPIIVITAYDYSEISEKASEIGITAFLAKPLFQSSLFDLLVNITGHEAVLETQEERKVDFTGAKIILAEDNVMNMEIAKELLKSVGIIVESVVNGSEAVTTFEASTPGTYDAILMDVHMPVMNGHQATKTIRDSQHPDAKIIPIIAMTADAFAENVIEAHNAGMNDHVAKPIDIQNLYDVLNKYIRKK